MFSGVRSITDRVRLGFGFFLVMALALAVPFSVSAAPSVLFVRSANIVSRVGLAPRSPNIITVNQQITISFAYNTTQPLGVIITAAPFTGAAATASATDCKTAVLPVGHGTGSCTISVGAAPASVDGIRFQMWDSTQKIILFQTMLPVSYQVSNAPNLISGLVLSPVTPNVQLLAKGVTVKFNYQTAQTAGIRIIAVPFTGTTPTPNYATCASVIYTTATGTGSCRFTILSGAVNVTSLHIQMWDATGTTMVTQSIIPVAYRFRSQATLVTYTSLSPTTPNIVRIGENVVVHFSYQTNQSAGIVVEAIPYTGTALTANVTGTRSAVLPTGTGKGSCAFMVTAGATGVSSVRLNVWDSTHTTLLFVVYLPTQYQFR